MTAPATYPQVPALFSPRLCASGRYAGRAEECAIPVPAYLVLLRVGFTMRLRLLVARCALTAPFHPYLPLLALRPAVYFLLHWPSPGLHARVPDVIRHTALRSSDFPPPSKPVARAEGGDRSAACTCSVRRTPANALDLVFEPSQHFRRDDPFQKEPPASSRHLRVHVATI